MFFFTPQAHLIRESSSASQRDNDFNTHTNTHTHTLTQTHRQGSERPAFHFVLLCFFAKDWTDTPAHRKGICLLADFLATPPPWPNLPRPLDSCYVIFRCACDVFDCCFVVDHYHLRTSKSISKKRKETNKKPNNNNSNQQQCREFVFLLVSFFFVVSQFRFFFFSFSLSFPSRFSRFSYFFSPFSLSCVSVRLLYLRWSLHFIVCSL